MAVVARRSRCGPPGGSSGVRVDRHEDPVHPVDDPPLGVRFEDMDGRALLGCVQVVLRCDGSFNLGGVEVRDVRVGEGLKEVVGDDGVFGALQWWVVGASLGW